MLSLFYHCFTGLLCLSCLAGCGGRLVELAGRVVADGQPLTGMEATPLEVRLTGKGDDKTPGSAFATAVGAEGQFIFSGATGKGVPPGTYTITLRNLGSRPGGHRALPWLEGLTDPATSPLKYEVTTAAHQRLLIDVAKKTVEREP